MPDDKSDANQSNVRAIWANRFVRFRFLAT